MKKIFIILFPLFLQASAWSQKIYFIYLQTENGSTFYLKMDDQVFSSSSSGYMILSNLSDSIYNFSIGFPSQGKEAKISVPLSGKDRGFILNNEHNVFRLSDIQTSSVIRAKEEEDRTATFQFRNDEFTSLLAKAANDSSLFYVPISVKQDVAVRQEEIKPEVKLPANAQEEVLNKKDTSASILPKEIITQPKFNDTILARTETKPEVEIHRMDSAITVNQIPANIVDTVSLIKEQEFKRSVIKKHSESSTSEGFGLVYFDEHDEIRDTIRILIPNPRVTFRLTDSVQQDQDLLMQSVKDSNQVGVVVSVNPQSKKNMNCPAIASGNDFMKLRKNMASKSTDEAMVDEAKKSFRNKCFSTEQVKNLSTLFLTSAGKYQFFDAVYLHVSDQEQFFSLQSEIEMNII